MSKTVTPLHPRFLRSRLEAGLAKSPAVSVVGPRQSGKSTLARAIVGLSAYRTLDDPFTANEVESDPVGFLRGLPVPAAIDEVQHAPALLRAVKLVIDEDRRPGRFLLTASADVLSIPQISESLAGRTRFHTLLPLAQAEFRGGRGTFLDDLLSVDDLQSDQETALGRPDLSQLVTRGGFPVAVAEPEPQERGLWLRDYLTALIQRDLRDLGAVRQISQVPRLLTIVAAQSPGDLNTSALSSEIGLNRATIERYLGLLEQTFILRRIPAWHANIRTQQIRSPKTLVVDPGLHCQLLGLDEAQLAKDPVRLGRIVEGFVGSELLKLMSWSDREWRLHHWRSQHNEVDFVLEAGDEIVGIDVKLSTAVTGGDFRGLRALQSAEPRRFRRGIILYAGARAGSFGPGLAAVPISALWE